MLEKEGILPWVSSMSIDDATDDSIKIKNRRQKGVLLFWETK